MIEETVDQVMEDKTSMDRNMEHTNNHRIHLNRATTIVIDRTVVIVVEDIRMALQHIHHNTLHRIKDTIKVDKTGMGEDSALSCRKETQSR